MDEKILNLYGKIMFITASNMDYRKKKKLELITAAMPDIQSFSTWFLEENRFGIENSFYQELCVNLSLILQDIFVGFKQKDYVLLHDALAYGFLEYLSMFVIEEDKSNDNL